MIKTNSRRHIAIDSIVPRLGAMESGMGRLGGGGRRAGKRAARCSYHTADTQEAILCIPALVVSAHKL